MQRIYIPNTPFTDVFEITEKNLYHQLTRVLRARVWQEVIFFDGCEMQDHVYSMIHIDKKSVSFKKVTQIQKIIWSIPSLILYQAQANKLSKIESIVQKCCEVGYSKIVFFHGERSQKLILSDNKKQRLQKIAVEAIEQCGGNIIPEITFQESIEELCENSYICHTQWSDSISLKEIELSAIKQLGVLVGPEWWFSPWEVERFINMWAEKIYFWTRILRCETVWEVIWFFVSQR